MRKLTHEQFIERCNSIHGSKYSYNDVAYEGSFNKITLSCEHHGSFEITPTAHLSGRGCHKCGVARKNAEKTKKHKSLFVAAACAVHNNLYYYDMSTYVSHKVRMTIVCTKHGDFQQQPGQHLQGQGCRLCVDEALGIGRRISKQEFVDTCNKRYNGLYDYSLTEYHTSREKIVIYCREHGPFTLRASLHQQGQGCPECSKCGYRRNKLGALYVMSDGLVTKVGITNRSVGERCSEISRDSERCFSVVFEQSFEDGQIPYDIENLLLKELHSQYKQPNYKFDGSTECFHDVNQTALLNRITDLIKLYPQVSSNSKDYAEAA